MASLNKQEKALVQRVLDEYSKSLTGEELKTLQSAWYRIFTDKTRSEVTKLREQSEKCNFGN